MPAARGCRTVSLRGGGRPAGDGLGEGGADAAPLPDQPSGLVSWEGERRPPSDPPGAPEMGVGETLQQYVTTRNTQIHDTESAAIIAGTTKLLELVDSALSVPE